MTETPRMSDAALRSQTDWLLLLLPEVRRKVAEGVPADAVLAAFYRAHRDFGSRDRRLFSTVVFAYFRWRGWIDPQAGDSEAAACALAWTLGDGAAEHPMLASLLQRAGIAPAAFAKLAAAARASTADLLVPDWLRAEVAPELRGDGFETLIGSLQRRPPTWIRCKRERREELQTYFAQLGVEATAHPNRPEARALGGAIDLSVLQRDSIYGFEVQDLASQCVGHACAPRQGSAWWDACSGSGGKTLHLADLMDYDGSLLATDPRPAIIRELEARARRSLPSRFSKLKLKARVADAAQFHPDRAFDGILVDAPCSGIGTWPRNPDLRWRTSPERINALAGLQSAILDNAARFVRPGGVLVYAVCTFTARETSGITGPFLTRHPDFTLDPFTHPLTCAPTTGALTIWPWEGPGDGMYIARMARRA